MENKLRQFKRKIVINSKKYNKKITSKFHRLNVMNIMRTWRKLWIKNNKCKIAECLPCYHHKFVLCKE